MNQRQTQVAEEVRSIVAPLLLRGDIPCTRPLVRVTITGAWVSADLRLARLYIAVPEDWHMNATLKALNREVAAPLRKVLAARLATKYIPEISFFAAGDAPKAS